MTNNLTTKIANVLGDQYLDGIVLCDWGSCQYTGAWNMFKALEKSGMTPLHVDVRYSNINTKEYVVADFKDCMETDMLKNQENFHCEGKDCDCGGDWDYRKDLENWYAVKDSIKTVADCFEYCKNQSWDLWSAAPWIAEICFDNLELLNVDQAPGAGPLLNVMVQGENYQTGFYCWLMSKHGFISDEAAFDGFDT